MGLMLTQDFPEFDSGLHLESAEDIWTGKGLRQLTSAVGLATCYLGCKRAVATDRGPLYQVNMMTAKLSCLSNDFYGSRCSCRLSFHPYDRCYGNFRMFSTADRIHYLITPLLGSLFSLLTI